MNTNRQLVLAWRQYARDSGNQLPYAYAHIGTAAAPRAWIPGGGALDLELGRRQHHQEEPASALLL
jgi:hypothetical protein